MEETLGKILGIFQPSSRLARLWTSSELTGEVGTGEDGDTVGVYSAVGMLHLVDDNCEPSICCLSRTGMIEDFATECSIHVNFLSF